jgi:AbrB family looped-hinge helix DNA binding protein
LNDLVRVIVDHSGRIVVPKVLRDHLRLTAGSVVDVSLDGDGLRVTPRGSTARLERHNGVLVAMSDTLITDEDVADLVDSIRR